MIFFFFFEGELVICESTWQVTKVRRFSNFLYHVFPSLFFSTFIFTFLSFSSHTPSLSLVSQMLSQSPPSLYTPTPNSDFFFSATTTSSPSRPTMAATPSPSCLRGTVHIFLLVFFEFLILNVGVLLQRDFVREIRVFFFFFLFHKLWFSFLDS
jgi:hypothetical protein